MGTLAAGTLLADRFEILDSLGQGGLAEVYRARDRATGAEVALKVLHAHLASEEAVARRFRREMAVTRGLDAPGIVRAFDLHEHQGRPFLSMELLRGQTLADRLKKGPLPQNEVKRIARELCSALKAAHRAGVVHRDLKPANIFMTESGQCKILDFGLARVAGMSQLTGRSAVMGTPGYLAPELLEGAHADPRADLYALGAVLFEALTGRRAFTGSDPWRVVVQQREGAPSPRAVEKSVSEADDAVVRRLLQPDPEQRFQDAAQLERALGGEAVPAPEPVPPALTAGAFDVVVYPKQRGEMNFEPFKALWRKTHPAAERLGVKPPREWVRRTGTRGAVVVAGCSKASADSLAELLRADGEVVGVEPHRARRPKREWLAKNAGKAALPVALVIYAILMLVVMPRAPQKEHLPMTLAFSAQALALWFAFWLALSSGAAPLLTDLPEGDPGLLRLSDAVRRRAARLEKRIAALTPAQQLLAADLLAAAREVAAAAQKLVARARELADEREGEGESADRREALCARLTEMGAALDDALARLDAAAADDAGAAQALQKLRQELDFVQRALPEVADARLHEPPALPAGEDDSPTAPQGLKVR